jgi:DNA-binding MurR/RpiR family transcriptional regulator
VGVLSPDPSVAERLRQASSGFAPAERRVVRALLAEYPLTGLEPLAVVAARAGTSGPTVLRVVGKLGFAGYADFQRTLRTELAARWPARLDVMPREPAAGLVDTVREAIRTAVAADLDRLAGEAHVDAVLAHDARHRRAVLGDVTRPGRRRDGARDRRRPAGRRADDPHGALRRAVHRGRAGPRAG